MKNKIKLLCYLLFINTIAIDVMGQSDRGVSLMDLLVVENDKQIPRLISTQELKLASAHYGACLESNRIISPSQTAHFIKYLVCGYVSPKSKYYASSDVLDRMKLAVTALLALQNEDGTIDLTSTNFHSTPDTGFAVETLGMVYSIMQQNEHLNYGELPQLIKTFLFKAGEALSVGGIHTPNHRWIVSAALSWINKMQADQKYARRIGQWHSEKVDIDADGQYNERSTSVYTPAVNKALIYTARNQGEKYNYLFDYVRKNLNLTFFLIHPDGSIVTEVSNRQDKYQNASMAPYHIPYRYMAIYDNSGKYAAMVDYIENNVPIIELLSSLPFMLEDSLLSRKLPIPIPMETDYHKYFHDSDIVRIRHAEKDVSVIRNNCVFLSYYNQNASLQAVRLSSAFFGKGQFKPQTLVKEGNTYVLSSTVTGQYYQPFNKEDLDDNDGDWRKMDKSLRSKSEIQELVTNVYVTEDNAKVTVKVVMNGPKNLPVSMEFAFREGGVLKNVIKREDLVDTYFLETGQYAVYEKDGKEIKIGPGLYTHDWSVVRGALPKLQGTSLYFTTYAPCEFEFIIE